MESDFLHKISNCYAWEYDLVAVEDSRKYDEATLIGMLDLLNAAHDHGLEWFVMASSSSAYGKPGSLPYSETQDDASQHI